MKVQFLLLALNGLLGAERDREKKQGENRKKKKSV